MFSPAHIFYVKQVYESYATDLSIQIQAPLLYERDTISIISISKVLPRNLIFFCPVLLILDGDREVINVYLYKKG